MISQTMENHVAQMAARLQRQDETITCLNARIGTLKADNAQLRRQRERDQAEIRRLRSELVQEQQKDVPREVGTLQAGPVAPTYRERINQ